MGGDGDGVEDLDMLRDAVMRALAGVPNDAASTWSVMAQGLGLCGLGIDEALGGVGGGARDVWAVMEAQGGQIVHTPFLSAMVLSVEVLKDVGGPLAEQLLRQVAAGERRISVAYLEPESRYAADAGGTAIGVDGRLDGVKVCVLDAEGADLFIVSAREDGALALFAVPADTPGLALSCGDALNGGRWGELALDHVKVSPDMRLGDVGTGRPALEKAIDAAVVATSAEAVGAMTAMLDRTLEYVKSRRQFGKAIGEFQVIQHRLVDMLIAVDQAAALARVARGKLDGPELDRKEAVSGAKVLIANACRLVSQGAVQLHGGIGTTEELDLSIFFRRALMAESLFGDAAYHLDRYEKVSRQKMERDTISAPA